MPRPEHDAARARLEGLAPPFLARPGVDWGRMFGTIGLRVRGKVFAVAVSDGGLMVKIPETRATERMTAGEIPRRGHPALTDPDTPPPAATRPPRVR